MNNSLPLRTPERLNQVIKNFLIRYNCFNENYPWEVRQSSVGGFGVFAKRDIEMGEEIFKDYPVIIGPRAVPDCPMICVVCYKRDNLRGCNKNCGLPICSETCENSDAHQTECHIINSGKTDYNNNKNIAKKSENGNKQNNSENRSANIKTEPLNNTDADKSVISQKLFNNFTPIKALLLDTNDKEVVMSLIAHRSDQHGHEIDVLKDDLKLSFAEEHEDFMRFVCCVMDANAFEVTTGEEKNQSSLRGLYPLGSLANHRCYPNVTHVFDKQRRMVCRAAVFIPKDSEIFHSYTRNIWGTVTRLFHLKRTKQFVCKCERCMDPTEFGTYMSAVLCKKCRGKVTSVNPYKPRGKWQCEDCKTFVTGQEVGQLLQMLGSILGNIQPSNFNFMMNVFKGKLSTVVPETNQVAVELKYKMIWVLGHKDNYKWQELSIDLLNLKIDLCKDILDLLKKLRAGQCKIRGLLLYELYCCYMEMTRRNDKGAKNMDENNTNKLLEEARKILKDDVLSPKELRSL